MECCFGSWFSVPSYIMRTTFNSIKERGYRVIMMDLYGRGFSDNPNLPQTDELRANTSYRANEE